MDATKAPIVCRFIVRCALTIGLAWLTSLTPAATATAANNDCSRSDKASSELCARLVKSGRATVSDYHHCFQDIGTTGTKVACTRAIQSGVLTKQELSSAYSSRAWFAARQGDDAGAVEDYGKALELGTSNPWLMYASRADAFNRLKQYGRAADDLGAAMMSTNDMVRRANIQFQRGQAFKALGDLKRAAADFEAALAMNVRAVEARAELAALAESGRPAAASRPQAVQSVAAAPAPATNVPARKERRVALVVANAAYRTVSALSNPARDGARVAAALRAVGFETVAIENDVTRDGLVKALRSFEDTAALADWAIVYYAGHGIEVAGVNYLVPVDARLRTDRDIQDEAVSLERVLSSVERARKLRLVILDACRDNPFASRMQSAGATRSIGRGFSRIEPEGGSLVAYAAKHGFLALDGDGENSPFVDALLRHIRTPNLEINKLFRLVRDDVLAATGKRQEPYLYGSLPGEDFFFVMK